MDLGGKPENLPCFFSLFVLYAQRRFLFQNYLNPEFDAEHVEKVLNGEIDVEATEPLLSETELQEQNIEQPTETF